MFRLDTHSLLSYTQLMQRNLNSWSGLALLEPKLKLLFVLAELFEYVGCFCSLFYLLLENLFVFLVELLSDLVLIMMVVFYEIFGEPFLRLPKLLEVIVHELIFLFFGLLKLNTLRFFEQSINLANRELSCRIWKPIFD